MVPGVKVGGYNSLALAAWLKPPRPRISYMVLILGPYLNIAFDREDGWQITCHLGRLIFA